MAFDYLTSETTKLAATTDPEFSFKGACEITAACPKANAFLESAIALRETAGKAVTGSVITAMTTGSPFVAGAVGLGIAVYTAFSGSKGGNARG